MSDIVRAVILGIVEGLTEFVPVSSTGHMLLVMPLLGIAENDRFWNGAFDIFIQIGAILAVVAYFWQKLWTLTFYPPEVMRDPEALRLGLAGRFRRAMSSGNWRNHILVKLFVAFLPAAVIGLLINDFIEEHLKNPRVTACALIGGGIAILLIEALIRDYRVYDTTGVTLRMALVIGFFQCLAMIPGTSRSGATIMGALILGMRPAAAAEFSFMLAIPTMFAAGLYSLYKHRDEVYAENAVVLGVGFVVSFIVAWVVVAAFMRFIQNHRFTIFAGYRIVIGTVALVYYLFLHQPLA